MFLILVFYQARFFFPNQTCNQEYVLNKKFVAYLFLIASLRYREVRVS